MIIFASCEIDYENNYIFNIAILFILIVCNAYDDPIVNTIDRVKVYYTKTQN